MRDSLHLRIGDITFGINSCDSWVRSCTQGAVRHFVTSAQQPDVNIQVRLADVCPPPRGHKLFDAGELWQLYRHGHTHEFRFTAPVFGPSPYKTATFNAEFTEGEVTLYGEHFRGSDPIYPLEYPLDELLMVNLLAQGRGVEVHGCGLRDEGGAGY